MIYVLLLILIILSILNYIFSGKDFFSPSTIQILTFAVSVFMCIYFMWSMDDLHEFHGKTVRTIIFAMTLTAIIGIVVHRMFLKVEMQAYTPKSIEISPISSIVSVFFTILIFFTIIWLLVEIRSIGGASGSFFETMKRFHDINSYSTNVDGRLPWFLRQMLSLVRVLFLIYGFNLIRFYEVLSFRQRCINFLVLGLCCLGLLLTGARTPVVNLLISCFMIFHLLRIQKEGKYKPYRMRVLVRIIILLILVMVAFFLTKSLVGRGTKNTMTPIDYISYYTGAQYIVLDQYFQNPPYASDIFGKETFYSFNQFLINYKIMNIPSYLVHLEFRPVGAGFRTNVYTFLRSYHYDFGIIGTFILHGISILFLSVFYEYVKKKRGNLGILIFSQMYYSIVMSFFAERFYSNIVSVNFIKQLILLLVLYELFIRKRIRFVFHGVGENFQGTIGDENTNTVDL